MASLLFLGVFGTIARQDAVLALESQPRRAFQESYLLPDVHSLGAISLGHNEAIADLIWLKTLSYFGVHWQLDQNYQWLDRYIETIISLDPNFEKIYEWAGVVVMYGGREINNQAVMTSNRFLEQGRQAYPDAWVFSFMLGVNYCFELQAINSDQRREWDLLCAEYLDRASRLTGSPAWLALAVGRRFDRVGAEADAVRVDRRTFLGSDHFGFASLAAEMTLRDHHPVYVSGQTETLTIVSAGVKLRQNLASSDWARMLDFRRLLYQDRDTESGYLLWPIRVLSRGEAVRRVRRESRTPVDAAFTVSLSQVSVTDDPE
jgi:hypothetical protein